MSKKERKASLPKLLSAIDRKAARSGKWPDPSSAIFCYPGPKRPSLAQQRASLHTTSNNTHDCGAPAFFLGNFVRHGKIPHRALLRPWVDMLHFHGVVSSIATKHLAMREGYLRGEAAGLSGR